MLDRTHTDVGKDQWKLTDDVVRLRQWATHICHDLPDAPDHLLTIGSEPGCWLYLQGERVSRRHAYLRKEEGKWLLRDAPSKNGVSVDGVSREEDIKLEPGLELLIGGTTLVAESNRSIALRVFLARILGWGSEQTRPVDLALRAIRNAAIGQSPLVLCGEGDLLFVARTIHKYALGTERPFVVCDTRKQQQSDEEEEEDERAAERYRLGLQALPAAKHGSLCVRIGHLPPDFVAVRTSLQDRDARVQLIMCASKTTDAMKFGVNPVIIPPLAQRRREIDRIVSEYVADAAAELRLPRSSFPDADEKWIVANAATSLSEIEKATLRVLAIREAERVPGRGALNRAATRLGMRRFSLARWVVKHKFQIAAQDEIKL